MPGRTWIIAPDVESLEQRWQKLIYAPADEKELLFHPHLSNKKLGDRHSQRVVKDGLHGYLALTKPIAESAVLVQSQPPMGFAPSTVSGLFPIIA